MTQHPPAQIRVELDGPAGRLEALLRPCPGGGPPPRAVLLCHPHPLHGGTMANKTLYRIARELSTQLGLPTLRFNYRGAGRSEGQHDGGKGELEDTLVALQWLASRYPGTPVTVVGYSFGAVVGLRAAAADERVDALVALGLPLDGGWDTGFLHRTRKPRFFVHGEHDEFGSGERLEAFVAELPPPAEAHVVPGADHLFRGVEDEAVEAVVEYIRRSLT